MPSIYLPLNSCNHSLVIKICDTYEEAVDAYKEYLENHEKFDEWFDQLKTDFNENFTNIKINTLDDLMNMYFTGIVRTLPEYGDDPEFNEYLLQDHIKWIIHKGPIFGCSIYEFDSDRDDIVHSLIENCYNWIPTIHGINYLENLIRGLSNDENVSEDYIKLAIKDLSIDYPGISYRTKNTDNENVP